VRNLTLFHIHPPSAILHPPFLLRDRDFLEFDGLYFLFRVSFFGLSIPRLYSRQEAIERDSRGTVVDTTTTSAESADWPGYHITKKILRLGCWYNFFIGLSSFEHVLLTLC
jgi:hypothetical protein